MQHFNFAQEPVLLKKSTSCLFSYVANELQPVAKRLVRL